MLKLKNIITHLLLVGLLPFQKRSLFSDVFAAVGTHEEADGTPTGGEQPWDSIVGGDAEILRFDGGDGCREGPSG